MWMLLLCTIVLVVFVNGWTDAPGAITNVVVTGSLSYRRAAGLAAACNLLGVLLGVGLGGGVMRRVAALADFGGGGDARVGGMALCCVFLSVILFAVGAWRFGIPTSESHGLMAAMAGASVALGGSRPVDPESFALVLGGLAGAVLLGYLLGRGFGLLYGVLLARTAPGRLRRAQIVGAAAMALMHGAQDGQKFAGVFLLAGLLAKGQAPSPDSGLKPPLPVLLLCACTMALGACLGGERIVNKVGRGMARLEKREGLAADTAGALSLLILSWLGVPVSTTHTQTAAILGAGRGRVPGGLAVFGQMVLAWVVTFPACGVLAFGLTRLGLCLLE